MQGKKITYVNWWSEGARTEPVSEPKLPVEEIVPAAPAEPVQQVAPQQPMQPTQGVPFIQPLVVVPYVSPDQPLYYFDPTKGTEPETVSPEYYEDMFEPEESYALDGAANARRSASPAARGASYGAGDDVVATKKKSKFNVFGLLCFLFGAIYVAMLFDLSGLINGFTYNFLYGGSAAFDIVKEFVTGVIENGFAFDVNTTLVPILVAAGALFAVITLIMGIATVASRTPVGIKVFAVIAFLVNAAAAIVAKFIVKVETDTFGLYILAGLSFLMCLMVLVARRKKI